MAFKLSKEQKNQWDELEKEANSEFHELHGAIEQFNAAVEAAREVLQTYADDYNAAMLALKNFAEEIASEWRGEFDDKSESWQASDKGQEISELIDALENFECDEFELDEWEGQSEPDPEAIIKATDMKPE